MGEKKVYIAAPLFNFMERERNSLTAEWLEMAGFKVFLPQRDAGLLAEGKVSKEKCYKKDIAGIIDSDYIIVFLDGAHVDEGAAFEAGYAKALKKEVIVIASDDRLVGKNGRINNMFSDCKRYENITDWPEYKKQIKSCQKEKEQPIKQKASRAKTVK